MVPYCTSTETQKPRKYSDFYYDGTVSFSGFWHDDDYETSCVDIWAMPATPKPIKLKTKDIEDFLRKKLWRREQFKR